MILMLIFSFVAQSQGFELPQIGKVIGENNFITVNRDATNIPKKFRNHVEAIGWTNYGCTVSHIGNGIALSAGHCFEAQEKIEFNQGCRFVKVNWGFRKGKSPTLTSTCEKILAMQKSRTSDFAILQFSRYPDAAIPLDLERPARIGDLLTFFSHPQGRPLEWSQNCPLEAPQGGLIPIEKMSYTCDSEGGSSGAVVLSVSTGHIVGIHNGGFKDMNYGTHLDSGILRELLLDLTQQ